MSARNKKRKTIYCSVGVVVIAAAMVLIWSAKRENPPEVFQETPVVNTSDVSTLTPGPGVSPSSELTELPYDILSDSSIIWGEEQDKEKSPHGDIGYSAWASFQWENGFRGLEVSEALSAALSGTGEGERIAFGVEIWGAAFWHSSYAIDTQLLEVPVLLDEDGALTALLDEYEVANDAEKEQVESEISDYILSFTSIIYDLGSKASKIGTQIRTDVLIDLGVVEREDITEEEWAAVVAEIDRRKTENAEYQELTAQREAYVAATADFRTVWEIQKRWNRILETRRLFESWGFVPVNGTAVFDQTNFSVAAALTFVGTPEQISMLDELFSNAYCFAYLADQESSTTLTPVDIRK